MLPTLRGWEEHGALVVYRSVAKFSCGSLPRILSTSCLARNSNDVKDSGRRRRVCRCAGAPVTDGRVREVCVIDALTVVHILDGSLFPFLVRLLPSSTA